MRERETSPVKPNRMPGGVSEGGPAQITPGVGRGTHSLFESILLLLFLLLLLPTAWDLMRHPTPKHREEEEE